MGLSRPFVAHFTIKLDYYRYWRALVVFRSVHGLIVVVLQLLVHSGLFRIKRISIGYFGKYLVKAHELAIYSTFNMSSNGNYGITELLSKRHLSSCSCHAMSALNA